MDTASPPPEYRVTALGKEVSRERGAPLIGSAAKRDGSAKGDAVFRRNKASASEGTRVGGQPPEQQRLRPLDHRPVDLCRSTDVRLAVPHSPGMLRRSREPSGNGPARTRKGGGSIWVVVVGVALAHAVVGAILLAAWLNGSTYFSRLIE